MAQKKTAGGDQKSTKTADDPLARFRRMPKALRIVYSRPRLFISLAVGFLSLLLFPHDLRLSTRLLAGWDVAVSLYLLLAFTTVFLGGVTNIRRIAALQDDGRFFILALTSTGAFASIAAIVIELHLSQRAPTHLMLAAATIILSWAAIHTTFALHYAHEYYRHSKGGGLAFPGDGSEPPDYWDFVYFSFVIGMTAQVSDVGITDRIIRRTAIAHGVVSFIFNTALLALMVNIAASAI
ncbi:MAG: DUF1345 domain-containing protein [Xanthobacteraceae bacterium]|nr:DUF1345 domain-containing protein [Xanthobacteraceae bacterium]